MYAIFLYCIWQYGNMAYDIILIALEITTYMSSMSLINLMGLGLIWLIFLKVKVSREMNQQIRNLSEFFFKL